MDEKLKQKPKSKPGGDIAMQLLIDDSFTPLAEHREDIRYIISEIQEIARRTYTSGTRKMDQNISLTRFKDIARHLVRDFGKKEGDILAILPQYQEEVADVVSNALNAHFIGFVRAYKDGPEGIFRPPTSVGIHEDEATSEARQQYIQEFTSLVIEIYTLIKQATETSGNMISDRELNRHAVILAQYRSTEFVKSLFNGSLVRQSLNEHKILWNDEKIRSFFTSGAMLHLMRAYRKDIENAFVRIAQAYDRLTTKDKSGQSIQLLAVLNKGLTNNDKEWQQEEADHLFTQSTIRWVLIRGTRNIEGKIAEIGEYYRTTLSPANMLTVLNNDQLGRAWTKEEVDRVFTPAVRQFLAVHYMDDCVQAAKRFAHGEILVAFYEVTPERKLAHRLR